MKAVELTAAPKHLRDDQSEHISVDLQDTGEVGLTSKVPRCHTAGLLVNLVVDFAPAE